MMKSVNIPSIFMIPVDGIEESKESFEPPQNEFNFFKDSQLMDFRTNSIIQYLYDKRFNSKNLPLIQNEDRNKKLFIFSCLNTEEKRAISSNADSSKIYMSEFLKHNWKLKAKRLIIKLKKRYTKKTINPEVDDKNIDSDDVNKSF